MKKIIPVALILLLTGSVTNAQTTSPNQLLAKKDLTVPVSLFENGRYNNAPEKDYEFYMKKSRNHRTVGWATLVGGVVLSGVGLLVANADYASGNDQGEAAATITIAGAVSGIVSIPFMIMASAYRHKAKMMLSSQKTGFGIPVKPGNITGISVFIPIGK
ncbi:MAG TPA: hypothetical protein PKJ94_11145 [Ferruginibacter sp.]|nr:hypothetical protein [Ferruginibacter sp.]